ncbi:MAG: HD domain-containing protein [Melioribacteraceae bacterium]|nr:HD domain-containing protein [Melioribacteraceae bacterium]
MDSILIENVTKYVSDLFTKHSNPANVYHSFAHTNGVVESSIEIGTAEGISDEELELVVIAAWFHDIGYLEASDNHEQSSCVYVQNFFKDLSFSEKKLDIIKGIIMSTKMPQSPKTRLEQIVCDADMMHLGRKSYNKTSTLLRIELETRKNKSFNDYEWTKINIDFLTKHKFFTNYTQKTYDEQKNKNLIKLQKKLRKEEVKLDTDQIKNEKLQLEKEKFESKKEVNKKAERGIETMFRNVMRTHVSFSSMADSKANIMISVNTLILTAIVAVLVRKLDANQHLIIPTILLTLVSMITLIFAVLVTRPNVTEGKFTRDDIKQKKANMLFFGSFYNMGLDEFTWGMKETINDREYLYDSMIKDFYYLGQVLGRKYKYLRICYSIFMYGLIVSVIAFSMAVFLYPEGLNPHKTDTKTEQVDDKGLDIRDILE